MGTVPVFSIGFSVEVFQSRSYHIDSTLVQLQRLNNNVSYDNTFLIYKYVEFQPQQARSWLVFFLNSICSCPCKLTDARYLAYALAYTKQRQKFCVHDDICYTEGSTFDIKSLSKGSGADILSKSKDEIVDEELFISQLSKQG